MKIFITGATGFIGSELVKELLLRGHIIHALFRDPKKKIITENKNLLYFKGDILDKNSLLKPMVGCDIVFHLAAYAKVWATDSSIFNKINVEGTRNVLLSSEESGIKKIVVTSTAGILGPSGVGSVNENSQRVKKFFTEYEKTKFAAEQEINKFIKKGLNITTLLPTRLYGPGQLSESNSVTLLIQKYISGHWHILPGNGRKTGNYVYIKDVINGHINAMEKDAPAERFVLGGININYQDFFSTIGTIDGKKQWMVPLPVFLMMMVSGAMWMLAVIFKIKPIITPGWVRKYMHHWSLSSQKAINGFDYHITPLNTGISETIDWLRRLKVEKNSD